MDELTVVGIDLAFKTWGDVGSATLTFVAGNTPAWRAGQVDASAWPGGQLSPAAMAEAIDRFADEVRAVAIGIDGPQGWRDPHAVHRKGVGRWCDYEARTPGKTGVFGQVFPSTYTGWVTFSIAVFADLLARPHVTLANEPTATQLDPPPATTTCSSASRPRRGEPAGSDRSPGIGRHPHRLSVRTPTRSGACTVCRNR